MARNNNYLVIMAGGIGSRFWPMSTAQYPKQFLDVMNVGKTLIQETVHRFSSVCDSEQVFVVSSANYKGIIKEQLPELTDHQILLEPCMRNTAPCIAYAVWKIKQRDPDANIVVAPSDHVIMDAKGFREVIEEGLRFVSEKDALLTLGMHPHKPATGYGYIQRASKQDGFDALYQVQSFKEKPDLATAESYVKDGDFFWNSGIFLWNVKAIESAIRTHLPSIAAIFDRGETYFDTDQEQAFIDEHFPLCDSISVDYGIMEKANNIFVRTADFGWSDVGTWGSLFELSKQDEQGNVIKGQVVTPDTKNTIVRVEKPGKKVIAQGLEDYIVVDTEEALLICSRDREQDIKDYVARLD